ncbi:MAG: lamin tail domain-containing protein, partial [Planctomycetia bacterium]
VHEIVSNIPGEIEAVLEQMMAKNVTDRFQSPADVVGALQPFAKRISTPFDTAELERLRIGELAPVTSDALRRAAQAPNTSDSLLRTPPVGPRNSGGRTTVFSGNVETPSPAGMRTIVVANPARNSVEAGQSSDRPAVPKKILVGGGVAGVLLMIVVAVVFGGLYSGTSSTKLDGGRPAPATIGDPLAKTGDTPAAPTVTPPSTGKKEAPSVDAETTDSPVVVTEFMFNPNSNEGDFNAGKPNQVEWVEIYNRSSKPGDLSGWVLCDEDGPCDPLPKGVILAPRAAAVLCPGETPPAEFRAAWGSAVKILPVGGWNQNMRGMSNNPSPTNEILALKNASGQIMDVAHYDDEGQWPKAMPGSSLFLKSTAVDPVQNNEGRNWAVSVDGELGAFRNLKTTIFDQTDVGSPGVVSISAAAATATADANHCAAVVFRKAADPAAREVLLVAPIDQTAWGLPVGPVIPGFSASASAVQESFDKAGVRTKILSEQPLGSAPVKAEGVDGAIPVFAQEVVEELP